MLIVVSPKKSGTSGRIRSINDAASLPDWTQNGVVGSFLGLPSILVAILLIYKKEGDIYGECKSPVILRYLTFVDVEKGHATHVYRLGLARLWCCCVLTRLHSEEQPYYGQARCNDWWSSIMGLCKSHPH